MNSDTKATQSSHFSQNKWKGVDEKSSQLKIRGSSLRPQRSVFKMKSLRPRSAAPEAAMSGQIEPATNDESASDE